MGLFTDDSDPLNVKRANVSFNKVVHSKFKFRHKDQKDQQFNELEYAVRIYNSQIFSQKADRLELYRDNRHENTLLENVHGLYNNDKGIFCLSGSLQELAVKIG